LFFQSARQVIESSFLKLYGHIGCTPFDRGYTSELPKGFRKLLRIGKATLLGCFGDSEITLQEQVSAVAQAQFVEIVFRADAHLAGEDAP